jgi:thioredoxin-like negative regulator of GroEL
MGLMRKKVYDRQRILAQAARARKRRRWGKAIALYQQILSREPDNPEILRKVAPLLAKAKQNDEAWKSYRRAAEQLSARGFSEQAIGLYREAAGYLPREVAVWTALAEQEVARGRRADAIAVLLAGRRHFRSWRARGNAIELLHCARKIDRENFEVDFDLAALLANSGARPRARQLLEALAARSQAGELRRVRARLFVLFPSPRSAYGWVTSLVRA